MSAFTQPASVAKFASLVERACLITPAQLPAVDKATDLLIGTHDGSFHCDEALAIGLLHLYPHAEGKQLKVVRTRNPAILEQCDIVVDVGAVYEPSRHRYDHHQREFQGTLPGYSTRLSSAGLVYQHFGKAIVHNVIKTFLNNPDLSADDDLVSVCFDKTYKDFMEHIDAIDNGIEVADGDLRYHVSSTLSSRVGHLNVPWNEIASPEEVNARFASAMTLTSAEFLGHLYRLMTIWWPARVIVKGAVDERAQYDAQGRIAVLFHYCPWVQHLFEVEKQHSLSPVIYTIYEDTSKSWRVQAVPLSEHSFESRKALPAPWRGLRDQVLSDAVSSIPIKLLKLCADCVR